MNKKVLVIMAIAIAIVGIVFGTIYFINLRKAEEDKRVSSNAQNENNTPISTSKVNTKYSTLEKAIEEGCFVITHNKIYNKDKLDKFIKNTEMNAKNRIEDSIKIIQFTIEGDPIITQLSYKPADKPSDFDKGHYILTDDNTRDKFGVPKVTTNEDIPGDIYGIVEYKQGKTINVKLALYAEIDYESSDAKRYEAIDICSYSTSP